MVAERLAEIVGENHVLSRQSELLVYNSDGLPGYRRQPRLAVFPGSRDETIAVVRFLAEQRLPFVPRGAGTGLSGGALADDIVVVGLHRLKKIISLDVENRRAAVEPGVVNLRLNRYVAPHGLLYAPDPSSEAACTIGGNVAENAGGPHCLKYGVTLNHVLAITAVLPDGEVVTFGSESGEREGYDLLGAFIGSEGCFGVALGVTGRLAPHLVVQDAVIPRTRLAEVLATIARIAATHRVHVCNVFHAGDGNLHPNIPYNADDPDESERVHLAMQEIMRACVDAGGSITGEHGVGLDKLNYIEMIFSPDSLDAMCRLRSAFDPDHRANPGKVVPIHSCQEWKATPAASRATTGATA